jgi:excisionase family DNA binding protein
MSHDVFDAAGFGARSGHAREALSEPLLNATAAAELLAVRPSWIYEAVRAGRLPHVKIGRHVRFLRSDLETWVITRRVSASPSHR